MTRRLVSMAGIVIAGTVLLTGCGAFGAGTSGSTVDPASEPGMPAPDMGPLPESYDEGGEMPSSAGGDSGGDAAQDGSGDFGEQAADEDRAVIISGTVSMRAENPIAMADAVADAAESRNGAIDRRAERASTDFEPAWAMLTVRVPAEHVDGMLDALRGLADVTEVDMGEQVVTNQVRDLEVRVNASRASVDRLTELLATAADTDVLLQVEQQLTQRTSELEQLLAQQRSLTEQVAMSTIEVQIRSTTVEGPTGTPTFWDGLVAGWQSFLAWGATFLFGLGEAVPTLVILAIVALIVWLIARPIIKRMRVRTTPVTGAQVVNPVTKTEEPVA